MMNTSRGTKTTWICKDVCKLAERPKWNEDTQTDGRLFSIIYIYRLQTIFVLIAYLS